MSARRKGKLPQRKRVGVGGIGYAIIVFVLYAAPSVLLRYRDKLPISLLWAMDNFARLQIEDSFATRK